MKRSIPLLIFIFLSYFALGFITNIITPIIPDIIQSYGINFTLAALLPFSIFIAYGIFSIPAGLITEKLGEKPILLIAYGLTFVSALIMTVLPEYAVAVFSLFVIGTGLAILQVSLNPLLRVVGGKEHYSVFLTLGQLVFGGASFVCPIIFASLAGRLHQEPAGTGVFTPLLKLLEKIIPSNLIWVSMYSLFLALSFILIIFLVFLRIPKIRLNDDERVENFKVFKSLFSNRQVLLYIIGIFLYIGLEISTASWMSQFLLDYHGFDPRTSGARAVAWFWGAFTLGTVASLILLKIFDSRHILIASSGLSIGAFCFALFGGAELSPAGFLLFGFTISPHWPVIYSLALNSVPEHHGTFSGLLVTATAGGAVVPLLIGAIGDTAGLRIGMLLIFGCLAYIIAIGFWAKPLVSNKRIGK